MKAIIVLYLCLVAVSCSAATLEGAPKECDNESTTYNETICLEMCARDPHKSRSYCANFSARPVEGTTTLPVVLAQNATSTVAATTTTTSTTASPSTSVPNNQPTVGAKSKPNLGIDLRSSTTFTAASFVFLYVFM